jgi:TolC family type I secretion outer membrane protein
MRAGILRTLAFCTALGFSFPATPSLAQAITTFTGRLSEDFQRALLVEPEWLAAIATRDASVESYPQARAALLPQVGFNAQRSQNNTDSSTQTSLGPLNRSFDNYPAASASIQARQALLRPKSWAALSQSKAQVRYAEFALESAKQELALRLVSIHAELFAAKRTIDTISEQISIQEKLSESARRQFEAGDANRVDLELSLSREHQLRAQLSQARLELENLLVSRKELTGVTGSFEVVQFSNDSVFRLPIPADASIEQWIMLAMRDNPSLLAQAAAIEASKEEVRKAGFDHYPTADLYASRSASKSAMDNTIGTEYRTTQVGVQLSIPIYAGGAVDSQVRQAQAGLRRAEQQLQAMMAKIRLQIDRDFRTIQASRDDVAAQKESLKALNIAFSAATKGRQAGISVLADELNLRSQIASVNRNIGRSNANAIVAWGRLMAVSNRLQQDQLEDVERRITQVNP